MIWYYLFMIILLVGIIVGLSTFISQYWQTIQNQLRQKISDIPHTVDRKVRYLEEEGAHKENLLNQGQPPQNNADRSKGVAVPEKKNLPMRE